MSGGAGRLLAGQLDLLRDGVYEITGTPVKVSRDLVRVEPADVVVVFDLRRYERWVLEATARAADTGATLIALTDGRLSPLAERAEITFVVAARGVGPFDSTVGAISLVHALDRRGRGPPPPQRDRPPRRGRRELARRHRPRRAVAAGAGRRRFAGDGRFAFLAVSSFVQMHGSRRLSSVPFKCTDREHAKNEYQRGTARAESVTRPERRTGTPASRPHGRRSR